MQTNRLMGIGVPNLIKRWCINHLLYHKEVFLTKLVSVGNLWRRCLIMSLVRICVRPRKRKDMFPLLRKYISAGVGLQFLEKWGNCVQFGRLFAVVYTALNAMKETHSIAMENAFHKYICRAFGFLCLNYKILKTISWKYLFRPLNLEFQLPPC